MESSASQIPTIYVVTPCLNAVETIDRTLQSVMSQAGRFHLQYHVQDGGSTDGTWERIAWWRDQVRSRKFLQNCKSVTLTASQEKDAGLYDAIFKAFSRLYVPSHAFMTWINADDILFAGALAFISDVQAQFKMEQISWIGGSTALIKNDRLISFWDFPRPTSALRAGLCDGLHWDFLQQEGTFFRGWLWKLAKPESWFHEIKLAGDWNLWRLFAEQASLVQANYPLGAFRLRSGQLSSQDNGQTYRAEIANILPLEERSSRLKALVEQGRVFRRIIRGKYPETVNYIYEEDVTNIAATFYKKIFGELPQQSKPYIEKSLLHTGVVSEVFLESETSPTRDLPMFEKTRNMFVHNTDWQLPAKTEQHAYNQVKKLWVPSNGLSGYVAFPWATAIDHIQCESKQAEKWLRTIRQFGDQMPSCARRITVCQHILLKQYIRLFKDCGVTDIFWSHATKTDVNSCAEFGILIHPFPLFAVHTSQASSLASQRTFLYSFIGAKANEHYLTLARSWTHTHLANDNRGIVRLRDAWHFNDSVYKTQILESDKQVGADLLEVAAAVEFRDVMSRSIFSLCPSGTGPNSIRLWESLGSGAIPVIIADTLALPGPQALWKEAAVFCPETEEGIKALPDQLARMAEDAELLERKRLAMRQLWLMYGPDCFVYDVLKLLVDEQSEAASPVPAVPQEVPNEDVPPLVGVAREIAAGRTDVQVAGTILWRGLSTRANLSPDDLRASVHRYPELVVAARMTSKLLPPEASRLLTKRLVEVLPELK